MLQHYFILIKFELMMQSLACSIILLSAWRLANNITFYCSTATCLYYFTIYDIFNIKHIKQKSEKIVCKSKIWVCAS